MSASEKENNIIIINIRFVFVGELIKLSTLTHNLAPNRARFSHQRWGKNMETSLGETQIFTEIVKLPKLAHYPIKQTSLARLSLRCCFAQSKQIDFHAVLARAKPNTPTTKVNNEWLHKQQRRPI